MPTRFNEPINDEEQLDLLMTLAMLLVQRAGGSVSFTEDEWRAIEQADEYNGLHWKKSHFRIATHLPDKIVVSLQRNNPIDITQDQEDASDNLTIDKLEHFYTRNVIRERNPERRLPPFQTESAPGSDTPMKIFGAPVELVEPTEDGQQNLKRTEFGGFGKAYPPAFKGPPEGETWMIGVDHTNKRDVTALMRGVEIHYLTGDKDPDIDAMTGPRPAPRQCPHCNCPIANWVSLCPQCLQPIEPLMMLPGRKAEDGR